MNFTLILLLLVVISGAIYLFDVLFMAKKRVVAEGEEPLKMPILIDYARSFFPVFLFVLLLRSFLVEPFRIPSGSLKPTLLVGDFVAVNKFSYGLRFPVFDTKFLSIGEPHNGDIAVFRWPPNTKFDYIKRVIGLPGDHVVYKNKVLTINGKQASQKFINYMTDGNRSGRTWKVEKREENLMGIKHNIYVRPDVPAFDFDITVPDGKYFMMGDNRDDSSDSRFWGFVDEGNLLGRAFGVWMSWDGMTDKIRWRRIGSAIH